MNATVEEYTSDEGLNFEKRERHQRVLSAKKDINEKAEPQLKSTIKGSTSPKQANVSWNESVPQDIAHKTYGGRRSGFSEATTAVPPSDQPIGDSSRNNHNNHKSPRLDHAPSQHQVQQGSRRHEPQTHSNYCSTSTPQSAGDWYVRRTMQQNANILPHGQTQYANPFHPAYPRSLNHSVTPVHHQPSPYPFSGPYTGVPQYLYGQPGESTLYGSAFREDPFYSKSYQDYEVAAQGRKTYAQPLPYQNPPFQAEGVDKEGNKVSANLEYVLENISQVLNQQNKAKPETNAAEAVAAAQTETTLTDLDLIKMMEERMVHLQRKNEEKLMEANQVLNYLGSIVKQDQRSNKAECESDRPKSAQYSYVQVPRAYHSQTLEYGTNYESISESSVGTEQDSTTGNSSGSSVSSIAPEARRVRYSPEIAVHPFYRRTESDTMDSEDDVSTDSTGSDDGTTVCRAETEGSNSRVVQRRIDTASGPATAQSAAMVRTQLEMMEELTALRRDLATLQQQTIKVNKIWFMQAINSFFAKLERYFRPVPQPGTQRLEWTCECGEDMYADLPIQDGSQYQQMLEFLTRPEPRAHQANPDPTPSQLEGGATQLNYSPLHSSQSSSSQHLSPSFTFGSGSTYVGTDASQTLSPSQNIFSGQNKYLELCVNINKYETKLAEIQVLSGQTNGAAICTDAHLFRQIYQRYHALRKHNWRRFLYRPAGIRFVHFGVQTDERVSFFSSDPLPPEDVITAKRYEYNLQPPVPPPIDSRTFLHYFYKHGAHSHSTSAKYVNRLPKKLGDSLTRSLGADDLLEGWGIHIIEGPNKVAICWALMAVLAASLAVSIVYDFLTRSGESGFAIGQWMVAALTVGLSALYFSLEDDVNTSFD